LEIKSKWGDKPLDEAQGQTKDFVQRLMAEGIYGISLVRRWTINTHSRVPLPFQQFVFYMLLIYNRTKKKRL